jgi:hypothetical protein
MARTAAVRTVKKTGVAARAAQWSTCSYDGTTRWEQGLWQGYPYLWTRANIFTCFNTVQTDLYYWDGATERYWTSWANCIRAIYC